MGDGVLVGMKVGVGVGVVDGVLVGVGKGVGVGGLTGVGVASIGVGGCCVGVAIRIAVEKTVRAGGGGPEYRPVRVPART